MSGLPRLISPLPLRIMLVAVEASGDLLGANLIKSLRQDEEASGFSFEFCGIGGTKMLEMGVQSPFDITPLGIIGFSEALKSIFIVHKALKQAIDFIREQKPDVVVLIDAWGFSIRLAKLIRQNFPKIRVVKYVAPQVWATRKHRAKTLAKSVDLLLALHHMDRSYFEAEGLETYVVGFPAVELDVSHASKQRFLRAHSLDEKTPFCLILPGSRASEIARLTSIFAQTAHRLRALQPDIRFGIVVAANIKEKVKQSLDLYPPNTILIENEDEKLSAMKAATVGLAASGTVSIELCVCGLAHIIAYRVDKMTWFIFQTIATIKYVNLINITAGKEIIPEFIQPKCRVDLLTQALLERIKSPELRKKQIDEQNEIVAQMGRGEADHATRTSDALIGYFRTHYLN